VKRGIQDVSTVTTAAFNYSATTRLNEANRLSEVKRSEGHRRCLNPQRL